MLESTFGKTRGEKSKGHFQRPIRKKREIYNQVWKIFNFLPRFLLEHFMPVVLIVLITDQINICLGFIFGIYGGSML